MADKPNLQTALLTTKGKRGDMTDALKRMNELTHNGSKEYNQVFRQASSNLLVVAGILLAFATTFIPQLGDSDLAIKLMATVIIISLTLSLAFGIVQQLMEAEYFRRSATRAINLAERSEREGIVSADLIHGAVDEIKEERGRAVKRWASIVQLSLLGISLLTIVTLTIYFLFR